MFQVVPIERISFLMQCNVRRLSKQCLLVVKLKAGIIGGMSKVSILASQGVKYD